MPLEITAHAPSREAAIQFLQAVNIATVDGEGRIVPIAEVQITGLDGEWTVEGVDGCHWNMRFYGTSEVTLRKPEPEGGWQPEDDLFDRTYINELVAGRTGLIPQWVASADDVIPPGYEAGQCRAYDPSLISTRANVWA
jgi:hypothetical protein